MRVDSGKLKVGGEWVLIFFGFGIVTAGYEASFALTCDTLIY